MSEKLAIFDIDHTITKHSTGEYFILEACRSKVLPWSVLLAAPKVYFAYRFGTINWDSWAGAIAGIENIPRETFVRVAEKAFNTHHLTNIFPGIKAIIDAYKAAGVPVYLATSSVDIFVEPLAAHLGVDGLLASRLEFADGVSTGRIEGSPVFGPEKSRRMSELLTSLAVAAGDCAFYSDSIHDRPLLEAVGMPVAVNPDWRLRRLARNRGWKILRCRLDKACR